MFATRPIKEGKVVIKINYESLITNSYATNKQSFTEHMEKGESVLEPIEFLVYQ